MHNDTDLKNIFVIFETGHNGTSLHACTGSPCSCGIVFVSVFGENGQMVPFYQNR